MRDQEYFLVLVAVYLDNGIARSTIALSPCHQPVHMPFLNIFNAMVERAWLHFLESLLEVEQQLE
jgi:hypothetical protein